MHNWTRDNGVLVLVLTVLTILSGVVLSEVQESIGWPGLFFGLLLVLGVFAVVSRLALAPVDQRVARAQERIELLVQAQVDPNAVDWLLLEDELIAYERSAEVPEIWLVTSDLLDDAFGGGFSKKW